MGTVSCVAASNAHYQQVLPAEAVRLHLFGMASSFITLTHHQVLSGHLPYRQQLAHSSPEQGPRLIRFSEFPAPSRTWVKASVPALA